MTSMSLINQHREMARLCVGCGICLGLCPTGAIKLKATKGMLTMNFDYSHCTKCGMCNKACPALFNLHRKDLKVADALGRIDKFYFGHSTDHDIRYHGASGGVVTALTLYMLKRRHVDKILVVRMTKFTAGALLTDSGYDLRSAQGSIYFKTFSLRILQEIIQHLRKGERVSLVGLPCQISALKRLLRNFEDKIYFIGLICNHVNELWYLEYIVQKYLPKNASPIAIGPRKDGWPGEIKMFFRMNKTLELSIPHSKFWGVLPSSNISSPLGCMLCEDHLASMADITAGDAWHPKFMKKSSPGVSVMIVRTAKGLKLLEAAVRDGVLYVEEAGLRDLLVTKGHHVIEGTRYAPVRKKLLQHRIIVLRELRDLDRFIVTVLFIMKQLVSRFKILRRFLGTSLAEYSLIIVVDLLDYCKRARVKELLWLNS